MPNNFVLLERIELNASAASVTFANIPQTGYTDLVLKVSGRDDRSSQPNGDFAIQVGYNGTINTGSIYSQRRIYGTGAAAGSDSTSSTSLPLGMLNSSTSTASTFGNNEVYIPNYTSSNFKSVSCDGVSENNATTAFAIMNAGLISTTNPITDIKIVSYLGTNLLQYSTFSLYGLAALGTTPAIAPKASGGNVIATDGTYWYHAFRTSGTFTPQTNLTTDILVVAGGGGGGVTGAIGAGGGGAGGLLAFTSQSLTTTNYTCTIGSGGGRATTGTDSQFGSLTLVKGGGGGTEGSMVVLNGGSGGGAWNAVGPGLGTSGQGNDGGTASSGTQFGAGGGGAGAAGTANGPGGVGLSSALTNAIGSITSLGQLSGGNYYFAGGGGGVTNNTSQAGGLGGGGAGSNNIISGVSGTINTGGGGGGGIPATYGNGNGGSGVIVVRYPI
jgi:hypothetical protein